MGLQKGHKSGMTGKFHSKETKDKISKNNARYWLGKKPHKVSKQTKKKMSNSKKGLIGVKSNNWKGGKFKSNGYIFVKVYNHPFPNHNMGYAFEHRFVMEKHLGRYLTTKERVHHINGIRDDNRLKNLKLFENESKHQKYHWKNRISYKLALQ